ncbi:hypothetical protein [Campylobacter rectus]|uniref:hypothetical protein n=1 Tax=Campylobacter rectus TaxID=203 RepID=UPI0023EFC2C1|nr:hypothetical protein [Campylobacter rectus]
MSSCANEIKFDLSNADYAESICENYVSQLLATGKQGLYARPDISNLQNFMISRPARCYRPSKKKTLMPKRYLGCLSKFETEPGEQNLRFTATSVSFFAHVLSAKFTFAAPS